MSLVLVYNAMCKANQYIAKCKCLLCENNQEIIDALLLKKTTTPNAAGIILLSKVSIRDFPITSPFISR